MADPVLPSLRWPLSRTIFSGSHYSTENDFLAPIQWIFILFKSYPLTVQTLPLLIRGKVLAKPEKVKWRPQVDDDVSWLINLFFLLKILEFLSWRWCTWNTWPLELVVVLFVIAYFSFLKKKILVLYLFRSVKWSMRIPTRGAPRSGPPWTATCTCKE